MNNIREHLAKYGVTVPAELGKLKKFRWKAGSDDWYVLTETGDWYWRASSREWKQCLYGPLDEPVQP